MKDGDIYKWKWKPEMERNNFGGFCDYHCKSRVAIVHEGKPLDLFWMNFGSSFKENGWAEKRTGAHSVCQASADFEFIANISDLEEIRHGEEVHYRREDIVDLRHSNNSNAPIYRRKNTDRDKSIMLAALAEKIEEEETAARFATDRVKRYRETMEKVKAGDTSVYF